MCRLIICFMVKSMLSKDSECFMFERDLFRLKQKSINQTMNVDSWNKLMDEGQELLDKYNIGDKAIIYYCYQEFITFVDFMRCKARNEYELAPRKKE